jgi:hypothetical protein
MKFSSSPFCDTGPMVARQLVISDMENQQQHNQANGSVSCVVNNLDNSAYGPIVKSYFRQDVSLLWFTGAIVICKLVCFSQPQLESRKG